MLWIFSPILWLAFFIFLTLSFEEQKFQKFNINLSVFHIFQNFLTPRLQKCFPMFILCFIVLVVTFRLVIHLEIFLVQCGVRVILILIDCISVFRLSLKFGDAENPRGLDITGRYGCHFGISLGSKLRLAPYNLSIPHVCIRACCDKHCDTQNATFTYFHWRVNGVTMGSYSNTSLVSIIPERLYFFLLPLVT